MRDTCPSRIFLLDLIILFGEECKLRICSLSSLLLLSTISSFFDTNAPVILSSNTLSSHPFLIIRHQVLHPHKTAGKVIKCPAKQPDVFKLALVQKTKCSEHKGSKALSEFESY
jgi:hypothetical protein